MYSILQIYGYDFCLDPRPRPRPRGRGGRPRPRPRPTFGLVTLEASSDDESFALSSGFAGLVSGGVSRTGPSSAQ